VVHTDRVVTANRPDIIIKNKKEKTCISINVAIKSRQKFHGKGRRKEAKIREFMYVEAQRMWNTKCAVTPVIRGANGIVIRGSRKYLEAVTGKRSIDSLQKTAILGTSHIIRKVLECGT